MSKAIVFSYTAVDKHVICFRYRSVSKTIPFEEPPGDCHNNEDEIWLNLLHSAQKAFNEVFGSIADIIIGFSQYIHGPIIPFSMVVKFPSKYSHLDIILKNDSSVAVASKTKLLQDIHQSTHQDNTMYHPTWSWDEIQYLLSHSTLQDNTPHIEIPYESLSEPPNYATLCEQLKLFGYAYLTLPSHLITEINNYKQQFESFFQLSDEEKTKTSLDVSKYGGYGGWYNQGTREIFHISPTLLGSTPPWPENNLLFTEHALRLFYLFNEITQNCLKQIAVALGIPEETLLSLCEDKFVQPSRMSSSCRVCYYNKPSKGSLIAEHVDTTILSLGILSDTPELEFYSYQLGQWINIEQNNSGSANCIVFVGKTLSRLTCGYLKAGLHRVFRTSSEKRISMPFFLRPKSDAPLQIQQIVANWNVKNWFRPSRAIGEVETVKDNADLWRQ